MLKERYHLGDLGMKRKITLKWILEKQNTIICNLEERDHLDKLVVGVKILLESIQR